MEINLAQDTTAISFKTVVNILEMVCRWIIRDSAFDLKAQTAAEQH